MYVGVREETFKTAWYLQLLLLSVGTVGIVASILWASHLMLLQGVEHS